MNQADIPAPTPEDDFLPHQERVEYLIAQMGLVKPENLNDVQDKALARINLGLGTAATHAATDFEAAGSVAAEATARSAAITSAINAVINGADAAHDTFGELQTMIASDETAAAAMLASIAARLVTVSHGSVAGTTRPTSALPVLWIGTVAPANAVARDLWVDETVVLLKRYSGSVWVWSSVADLLTSAPNPLFIAHRGGSLVWPEETVEGYRAAAAKGLALEPDIQSLSDGTLVCIHDATVDRTMSGSGNVNSFTLAQWNAQTVDLPAVPGGLQGRPLTWKQLADEFGGRALLVPECKDGSAATRTALIADIKARGLQKSVIVQSFFYADCQAVAAAGLQALFLSDIANPATLVADGVQWVGCSTGATSAYVSALVAAGIKVVCWTIAGRSDWDAFLATNPGVRGCFTDDPEWTARVFPVGKINGDPFARQSPSPGLKAISTAGGKRGTFVPPNKWGISASQYAGSLVASTLGWAGLRGPYVRIRFTVHYGAAHGVAGSVGIDQSRWTGLFLGAVDPEVGYNDGAGGLYGVGYHFLQRRNGNLDTYETHANTAVTIINSTATGANFAPSAGEGRQVFEVEVNSTSVIVRTVNSLTGVVTTWATIANTTNRGNNWILQLGTNGTEAYWSDVIITDLAS